MTTEQHEGKTENDQKQEPELKGESHTAALTFDELLGELLAAERLFCLAKYSESRRDEASVAIKASRRMEQALRDEYARLLGAFNELKSIHEQTRAGIAPLCEQNALLKQTLAALEAVQ